MTGTERLSNRRNAIAVVILAILFSAIAGSVRAQDHPNIARGFNAETPFQMGEVDTVNVFNGNATIVVPIGQEYRVGGNLAYSFKLVYNGQQFAYRHFMSAGVCLDMGDFPMTCSNEDGWTEAIPGTQANAALGWQLTLGELTAPQWSMPGGSPGNFWVFHSPDGSSHKFYKALDVPDLSTPLEAGASGSNVYGYTRDNTYMRLIGEVDYRPDVGSFGKMTVQLPDGTSYVFLSTRVAGTLTSPPLAARYYLHSVTDVYGNRLEIQYQYLAAPGEYIDDPAADPANADRQHIVEYPAGGGTGRVHDINFVSADWYQTKLNQDYQITGFWTEDDVIGRGYVVRRKIIDSVTVAAATAMGGTATYHLATDFRTLNEPCEAFLGWKDRRMRARVLTAVDGPHDFHYGFTYPELAASTQCSLTSGHVETIELPTGGTVRYALTRRSFPMLIERVDPKYQCSTATGCSRALSSGAQGGGDHRPPFLDSVAVATRTVSSPQSPDAVWSYGMARRCPSPQGQLYQEVAVVTHSPGGETIVDYFNTDLSDRIGYDDSPGHPNEYALPYSKLPQSQCPFDPDYYLSSETVATNCVPFAGSTLETSCGMSNVCGDQVMRRTYVKYAVEGYVWGGDDDENNYDLNRRLVGTITVTRKLVNGVWVDDICADGNPCHTKVEYSDFDRLGHYRKETRSSNNGGLSRTTVTNYNVAIPAANAPWLFGQFSGTSVKEGSAAEVNLTAVCWDDHGFMTRKRVFRGLEGKSDFLTVYTRDAAGNAISESRYAVDGAFDTCGGTPVNPVSTVRQEWTAGAVSSRKYDGVAYKDVNLTIDAANGLPLTSLDPANRVTTYTYDQLGRLIDLHPPHEAGLHYEYDMTASPVHVTTTQRLNETAPAEKESHYYYDGSGRLIQEKRRMPSCWATIAHAYDESGRKSSMSVPTCTSDSSFTADLIAARTTYTYDKLGRQTRVVGPDGSIGDTVYTGSRRIDRSSRVVTTRGNADPSQQTLFTRSEVYDGFGRLAEVFEPLPEGDASTRYEYDFGDRLTSVVNGQNPRTFDYDRAGLLIRDLHPERGEGLYDYDAGAHLVSSKLGTAVSLSFTYDAAERLTEVHDDVAGALFKKFVFDSDNGVQEAGKLLKQTRYNRFSDATYEVTDRFSYDADTGRVDKKTTSVVTPTGTVTTEQPYDYDQFGQPSSIQFPRCLNCGSFAFGARSLDLTWSDGLLTAIGGVATQINYAPTGAVSRVTHATNETTGTGVVDEYRQDPSGIARPSRIVFSNVRDCTLLLKQPVSQRVSLGGSALFTVQVAPGTTLQWYEGLSGDVAHPIAGAVGTQFTTPSLTTTKTYWVRATAAGGGCTEDSLTVTAELCVDPVIRTPAATAATTVFKGLPQQFAVDVTGVVNYAWFTRTGPSGTLESLPGNGATISYTPTQAVSGLEIIVRLTWACGSVDLEVAILNVIDAAPCTAHFDPVYTNIFPKTFAVMPNELSTLTALLRMDAASQSYPKLRYSFRWYFDGDLQQTVDAVWRQGDTANPLIDRSGPFRSDYPYRFVDQSIARLEAWVSCYTNAGDPDSSPASISDKYVKTTFGVMNGHCPVPDVTITPGVSNLLPDNATIVLAAASTYPDATYQWYEGETGNTSFPATAEPAASINVNMPGTYWVRVSSECGGHRDSATITVSRAACQPVRILREPEDATTEAGVPVPLSVDAAGIPSPSYYLWHEAYNGPDEGADQIIESSSGKPAISVAPLETTDYYVRVASSVQWENDCSVTRSRVARVHVTSCTDITIQSQPADALFAANATSIALSITATSPEPLEYRWYNGESGDRSHPIDGAAGSGPVLHLTDTELLAFSSNKFWVRVSIPSIAGMPKRCAVDSRTVTVCRLPRALNAIGPYANSVPQERRVLEANVIGDNLTYEWRDDTGTVLNSHSNALAIWPLQTTTYTLLVKSGCAPQDAGLTLTGKVSVCPLFRDLGIPTATKTIVPSGTTTTLSVSVDRGDKIEWYFVGANGTPEKFAEGALLTSVQTPPITTTTAFFARAVSGDCHRDSERITIAVCTSPAVRWGSGNPTQVAKGATFTLAAAVGQGETANFKWYQGATAGDVANSTLVSSSSNVLQVASLQSTSRYWVRATDDNTGCTSDTTVHTVNVCVPTILTQPQSTMINAGGSATLTVVTDNLTGFTYQWYKGQSPDVSQLLTGQISPSLTVNPTANTTYWVRVTGCPSPLSPVTRDSEAATVSICQIPNITTPPSSSWQTTGPTTLTVTATGTELTYQWYSGSSGDTSTALASTAASLTVSPTQTTNYWVRVAGRCGSAQNSATAKVSVAPSVAAPSGGGPITKGQTRGLSVTATGTELSYQWYQLPASGSPTAIPGATASSYTTPAILADATYFVRVYSGSAYKDSGNVVLTVCSAREIGIVGTPTGRSGDAVTLQVLNAGANETFEWYVGTTFIGNDLVKTVYPAATTTYWLRTKRAGCDADSAPVTINICYPAISAQPDSSSLIPIGTSKTLTVAATGTNPLVYQWYQGAVGVTSSPVGTNSNTFNTGNLSASTAYWVRISTNQGVCVSRYTDSQQATVNVCQPPNISTQPLATTNNKGISYSISVTASGDGLHYQWYVGESGDTSTPVGTDSSQLPITAGTTKKYWVRVTGTCGTADSVAALQSVTPVISSQPKAANVCGLNGMATFTVATQDPVDGYKWYRTTNGVQEIVGTVNPLNVAVPNASATFKVVVTSGAASATSPSVGVTVLPVPTVTNFTATQETSTRWLLQTTVATADFGAVKYRFYEGALGDVSILLSDTTTNYIRVYPPSRPKTYWVAVYYPDTGCATNRAVTIQ